MVAGYYFQAINADAPHPAAARLWEEFLYSDEGQNLWLAGGARPVRADAMVEAGTIDQEQVRRPARGRRHAGHPDQRADREDGRLPGGQLGQGRRLSTTAPVAATAAPPAPTGRRLSVGPSVGLLPFLGLRHDLPADPDDHRGGRRVPGRRGRLLPRQDPARSAATTALHALRQSLRALAASSAAGRRRAGRPAGLPRRHGAGRTSLLRRVVTAVCGVLAQFGGVTLAFAWIATLGFGGLLTNLLADTFGIDPNGLVAGSTSCPG